MPIATLAGSPFYSFRPFRSLRPLRSLRRLRRLPAGAVRRALVAALLMIGSAEVRAQASAPPAPLQTAGTATLDLDGDGKLETIAARGTALEVRGAATTVRLPGTPRLGSLVAVTLGAERLIAVEVTLAGGAVELWVGRKAAAGFTELARLPLGPQGGDGEYGAAAELSARGLWRWQTRPDLVRCDGAALRLFAERWEPAGKRWVAAETTELPSGAGNGEAAVSAAPLPVAPVAAGPSRTPPGRAADVFRARSTTSQRGAQRADELAIPSELDDGDVKTAWRSGGNGDGRGEVLGFRARLAAGKALRLRVVPGDVSSATALRASGRPAKLAILGKRLRFSATLPDPAAAGGSAAYLITLPQPIEECLSVVIEAVHPAAGGAARLAISELSVETDLEERGQGGGNGTAALAAAVAKGGDEGVKAAGILARRGGAAAAALIAELGHAGEVAQKRRLARALAMLSEKEIGEPLTSGVRDGWIAEEDQREAIDALGRVAAYDGLAEIVEGRSVAPAARLAAAVKLTLGKSPQLLTVAGVGPTEVRKEVIVGLSRVPRAELLAAATAAGEPSAAGDLWRAAVRAALEGDAAARRELAAALPRVTSAGDYERRYRLATGHAELAAVEGDAAAVAALLGELENLSVAAGASAEGAAANAAGASTNATSAAAGDAATQAERAALRQAVATVVAKAARPELLAALQALLDDGDAGVRLAAMRGLADLDPSAAPGASAPSSPPALDAPLDAALGKRLAGDRWPELRRAAAASLSKRCQRAEPAAALGRAVDGDRDVDVRQDALLALVTCRAPGIAERLAKLWDDGDAPLPLRSRAVTLTVVLGDARLTAGLLRSFVRWRSEAFSDEAALRLAVVAAGALGQLGGQPAAAALLAALEDTAYPELVAAAATGLGAMGLACPPAALPVLQSLTRSDERSISLAARRAVGRCGGGSSRRPPGDAP